MGETMAKANYTHLTLVVDRSGSMGSLASDATGGINAIIKEQLAEDGEFTFTLIEFDNSSEIVARMSSAELNYELKPRGGTALFDAIQVGFAVTEEDLSKLPDGDKPEVTIFMIVTDGHENASRETRASDVRRLIQSGRDQGWDFQFLAAGEAVFQADDLGMRGTSFRSNSRSVNSAYRTVNEEMKRYRKSEEKLGFMLSADIDDDFADKYESDKDSM
jgi:hypothetical protein